MLASMMAPKTQTIRDAGGPDDRPDDRKLAEAARDGNRAAFARLHDRYLALLDWLDAADVPVALGLEAVQWGELGRIMASWLISPALSGTLAFLIFTLLLVVD